MSTKTTFKRIALVVVAALGFGVLTTMPASAVENANPYTSGSALSTSSLTVVAATTGDTLMGKFYVDVTSNGTLLDNRVGLFDDESITVTTTAAPSTSTAAVGDLSFIALTAGASSAAATASVGNATDGTALQIPNAGAIGTYDSPSWSYSSTTGDAKPNRYWFGVYAKNAVAIDGGEYTVRVRVVTGDVTGSTNVDKTLKVKFVSEIANAGAVVTVTSSGSYYTGQVLGFTAADYMQAVVKDANGGRVVLGKSATGTLQAGNPAMTAYQVTAAGVVGSALTASDTGVDNVDHAASSTALAVASQALQAGADGTFGITGTIDAAEATTTVVRVRLTGTSTQVNHAMVVYGTTGARDIKTDVTLTAAGILAGEELVKSPADTITTYTLPLTTTSAKIRFNLNDVLGANVPNAPITTKTTWSGNHSSAAVSPATQTTGTVAYSDASGNVDVTITNSTPVAGGSVSVLVTGFAAGAGTVGNGSRTVTLNWAAPVVTTIEVIDPVADVIVKTKSTNILTVSVSDQFGNAMSGEQLQPSLGSTDANYSATTRYGVITTGTTGTATFTLTDAAAVADDTDTVSFASVSRSAATPGSFTLTYATTLPVVATLTAYYDLSFATASPANLVPSTGIRSTGTTGVALTLVNARNTIKSLSSFATDETTDDMVGYRARALTSAGAAAAGAAVTVTASAGAWLLDSSGLPTMSRTFAVGTTGYISWKGLATSAGTKTFTITSGTVTATASQIVAVPGVAAARTIAISGPATGSSNGDALSFTVKVTDRYGNAVTAVPMTVTATGIASFAGGSTTTSFTTDDSGTYTFLGTSTIAAGGAGGFTATLAASAADAKSAAGYVSTSAVDSTLAAGVASASTAVTFAAGDSTTLLAAQAANDAAAEATDAANAATDAANAAAEAADAATAAAQDAADAVAALSAQVSSMMSSLKAQLTALTNLVIKIQKKVKA